LSNSTAQCIGPAARALQGHTFSATFKTVGTGTQSLTASDGTLTGSQNTTVNPASASVFVVSDYPNPTTAGDAHTFTVTAEDAYGNTDTNYTGKAHFTSSDGLATLPADHMFTSGNGNKDNGSASFSATLKTTGSQSLTATDTLHSSITGKQVVTVNPATTTGGTGGTNGNGGQGTIKLEVGGQDFEVDGNDNNEPKAPCVNGKITFNVIGDGLAANTSVNVTAEVQGGSSNKTQVYNTSVTTDGNGSFTILNISLDAGQNYKIEVTGTNGDNTPVDKQKVIHSGDCTTTSPPGGGGNNTPELGSGELLATGLLPIGAILFYRRQRNRRAS